MHNLLRNTRLLYQAAIESGLVHLDRLVELLRGEFLGVAGTYVQRIKCWALMSYPKKRVHITVFEPKHCLEE